MVSDTKDCWLRIVLISLVSFALFSFTVIAVADARPLDTRKVKVTSVKYKGSGCPQGTVNAMTSPEVSALTVFYDDFLAQVGGVSGEKQDDASCTVKIKLDVPRGWTVSVESVDVRGFVSLDRGLIAQQGLLVKTGEVQLPTEMNFGVQLWQGPIEENFVVSGIRPVDGPKWLSCVGLSDSTKIEIQTRISVDGGTREREGLMTVDTVDGRMEQRYRLVWRDCFKTLFGSI